MRKIVQAAAAGCLFMAAALFGADLTLERSFVSAADFEPFYRDAAIDIESSPGAITLRREHYFPGPVGNKLAGGINGSTRLSGGKAALKRFRLPDGHAAGVELFAFPGGSGKAWLNCAPVEFGPFPHHGGWVRAEIGANVVKAGVNELVLGDGLAISQDRETAARDSFFSEDGGKSWKPAEGGEFLIHIRARRYAPKGVITSPVIDLAAAGATNGAIAPLFRIRSLDVQWRAIVPAGGAAVIEARTGPTPWPDGAWTAWSPAERALPGRYAQIRATLATASGDRAPSLARLTVTARGEAAATAEDQGLVLREFRNPPLVRASLPYAFQRPSDKLKRLRELYNLDAVVAAGQTDLDKALLLRNWVRSRWTCNDAGSARRTWDALEILGAPDNEHGMCVHFATAYYQCALALGFNARPVILTGHFVAEIWCKEPGKWVLMDVESVQPEGFRKHGTAFYLHAATREPLGALELHQAVVRAMKAGESNVTDVLQIYAMDTDAGPFSTVEAVRGPDSGLGIFRSFCLPPRNNYLDQLEPWEEMHGENHYHSNAYLWWRTQSPFERDAQYSWKTDRAGDVNWTVHTPRLGLTASETPGLLTVTADTVTPNLHAYRFAPSGRDPVLVAGEGDDPDSRRAVYLWRLEPGANTLSVTTLNRFGREGRAATVSVEWKPATQEIP
jgi:hypothetical protein